MNLARRETDARRHWPALSSAGPHNVASTPVCCVAIRDETVDRSPGLSDVDSSDPRNGELWRLQDRSRAPEEQLEIQLPTEMVPLERDTLNHSSVQHYAGLHRSLKVKHVEADFVDRPKDLWLARYMRASTQHSTHTEVVVRRTSSSVFDT